MRARGTRRRRRMLPLRRGYSLAAVFLLIATIAVLAAMARSIPAWGSIPYEIFLPNLVIGLLGGALIGGTVGIHYEKRLRSTLLGIFVGSLAGAVAATISIANFSPSEAFINCAVLIGLAVLVRLTTTSRPKPAAIQYSDSPTFMRNWPQLHRGRLLVSGLMVVCAIIAIYRLIAGQIGSLSATTDIKQPLSNLGIAVCSLGLAAYLLWTAFHQPPTEVVEQRNSPWE